MNKNDVIQLLKTLLQREFLQRDIYETYSFYLFGLSSPAIQEHLKVHLQEEQLHIETLQRYLMGLGAKPVIERANIPAVDPLSLETILALNFNLEQDAVKYYSEAIEALEGNAQYTALRIDLEDILKQEQEHTHDLIQWLGRWDNA